MNQRLARRLASLAGLLGALLAPHAMLAQTAGSIIISVPDQFPDVNGTPVALVLTEADRSAVVLRRDRLNPQTLEAALRIAVKASEDGVPTGQARVDVVTGFVVKRPIGEGRAASLRRVIAALRSAPTSSLGALGQGRWVRWSPEGS